MYKIVNRKKLIATAVADAVGKMLFLPVRLFHKQEDILPETVRSICVIRTAYIGDVVMTLPLLAPLKRRFPEAAVTFLTASGAAPLLEGNPYLDSILTFDPFWFYPAKLSAWLSFIRKLRRRSFDLVIEARADIRELALIVFWMRAKYKISYDVGGGGWLLTHVVPYPGLRHKVQYHLDMTIFLGAKTQELETGIHLSASEQETVCLILQAKGISGDFIALHPGSRLPLKRCPPECFAQLCGLLSSRYGLPILLLGSSHEEKLVSHIQSIATPRLFSVCGRLSLRQLAAVIGRARLFICNDSAPMHIASAMKTPTVAVFGPSKSVETGPWGGHSAVVEKEFSCRFSCDESRCSHAEHNACLKQVTAQDVLAAAVRLLEQEQL
jgi:predicted lipopolysaccharide heptosyltransferase III